jgi:hypothetical protein
MEIISKKDFLDFNLPLPIYTSIYLADAIDNQQEKYNLFIGLNKDHVEQLKKLSLDDKDKELQNNTGDRKRFGLSSYEKWYSKNRTPFILIHCETGNLAALLWFGPKSLGKKSIKNIHNEERDIAQNEWHTIAWRSYPLFRGRGLMRTFSIFAIDIYKKTNPEVKFWAGMDNRNEAIIALTSKIGFIPDKNNSDLDNNWLVVVKG